MVKYRYTIEDTSIETLNINDIPEGVTYETIEFEIENNTPIIEVPLEVPLWRIRTVLKLMGLEETVKIALDNLEEPIRTAGLNIWEYGVTIERNSPTVALIKIVLEMTDEEIDNIFISANNIQV